MRDKLEIAGMLREIALLRLHDEEQFRTQRTNEQRTAPRGSSAPLPKGLRARDLAITTCRER
jgi:hypothetical protein